MQKHHMMMPSKIDAICHRNHTGKIARFSQGLRKSGIQCVNFPRPHRYSLHITNAVEPAIINAVRATGGQSQKNMTSLRPRNRAPARSVKLKNALVVGQIKQPVFPFEHRVGGGRSPEFRRLENPDHGQTTFFSRRQTRTACQNQPCLDKSGRNRSNCAPAKNEKNAIQF